MSIDQKLKAARVALGIDQKEMSARTGIPLDTYKKYEGAARQPGAEAIAGIIRAGISANWLLMDEGPMLLKDLQPQVPAKPKINVEALSAILDGARQGLPKASTLELMKFAVDMYMNALERGLITPDGVGTGNAGKAA